MTVIGAVFNYYILLPLYGTIMGGMSNLIGASAEGNASINSLTGIIVLGITPFNILKGVLVSIITFVSYKKISPLINKENLMKSCKELNVCAMTLEVRASNLPAINLYKKHNFALEGVRKNFYEHPREDGHIMWNYNI